MAIEPTVYLYGQIIFAGDWHGSFLQFDKVSEEAKRLGVSTIIQLGDFGIWHDDSRYLNKMTHYLQQRGQHLYFVDGNHEDFKRLATFPLQPDGTRKITKHITHLPRGLRLDWDGLNVLALGGAASIDRKHRRKGHAWWPEELITEEDVARAVEGGPADLMLCHDSPCTAPNSITDDPYLQNLAARDFGSDMIDYCHGNRVMLAKATDAVKPRLLLHGHYHMFMAGTYRHADGTTAYVKGLDQGTGMLERCTTVLGPEGVRAHILTLDNIN
jgi:predicted phosphodiesterase